jgi:hypothetical protein
MNKPLILSLAAACVLGVNLEANSMFEKFQAMEIEMQSLKQEIATLKKNQTANVPEVANNDADEEEEEVAKSSDEENSKEDEGEEDEFNAQEEIEDIQETISELNRNTSGNHLKLGVDYRFALDNLQYTMANGDEAKNDALMTNRLWINMDWMATKNLSFTGQLAYNKAFGARSGWGGNMVGMEEYDWITNENPYDDKIRVRSAYFLYRNDTFLGTQIPWTFSVGRRPSTNGHLVNLRDDDKAASPMGHTINVEFDGLSAKFGLENLTGVRGMYAKLCAGRGGTNAGAKFFSFDQNMTVTPNAPYAANDNDLPDIDLAGLIFVPYDDGQYSINTQYYYANNLIDANIDPMTNQFLGMETVGGMHSVTVNLVANGIGDGITDFLDETTFFVSGAMSKTDPKDNYRMLYSEFNLDGSQNPAGESKTGYSVWAGLQFPSLISEYGRWGLEYNHGTEYWRSITYGEDTLIGSKLAARGDAYEAYFTEYLVDDILSLQVRYTYIDYKYTGSNGFFGDDTGASMLISDLPANYAAMTVDKAQDIRFYIRYKY